MNYRIPIVKPIEYRENIIPIHPYLLGVLIGVGGLSDSGVKLTSVDSEIIDEVKNIVKTNYPELSVKQAHIIRNWFNQPANSHLQFLARWPNHSNAQRTAYEAMIKPLVYPDYDQMTFQVGKIGRAHV